MTLKTEVIHTQASSLPRYFTLVSAPEVIYISCTCRVDTVQQCATSPLSSLPAPCSAKSRWRLEISYGESVYTTGIGKGYTSGVDLLR